MQQEARKAEAQPFDWNISVESRHPNDCHGALSSKGSSSSDSSQRSNNCRASAIQRKS
jgi:hypothetical protein